MRTVFTTSYTCSFDVNDDFENAGAPKNDRSCIYLFLYDLLRRTLSVVSSEKTVVLWSQKLCMGGNATVTRADLILLRLNQDEPDYA